jgi:hypothetical protein
MKTFSEFLEESSTSERGRRRLSSRGPSKRRFERLDQRREIGDKIALKKAGFRQQMSPTEKELEDHETSSSPHHSTTVHTYPSQADYAINLIPDKNLSTGQGRRGKVKPTSNRVRILKSLRKQFGGDRTRKKVHDVGIYADLKLDKNTQSELISRGKSFNRELGSLRNSLASVGAQPGDKVAAQPSSMMYGEDPKTGREKRDKIYTRRFGKKMNPKTNITVGTFKEFLELAEKYYAPDDKLPSGKTPVGKATQKGKKRARTIGSQSPQNQERWAKQYDLTQTKVKHGADNPELNTRISHKDKDDIKIDHDEDGMYLHHKPSSVNFAVTKSDESPWGDVRTISWGHDKNKMQMSPRERVKLGRTAKQVWDQHVSHRLPKGSIVHNTPISSHDDRGREKPINRRSEIYKRSGFGPIDSEGDQFASVGREPSSKQKAKGRKSRLNPLNPRRTKVDVEWGKDRDDDYDEWED